MDELIKTWKTTPATELDQNGLQHLLDQGLARTKQRLRTNLLADMGGAFLVALTFSVLAFFMELQYRWVVLGAMTAFVVLMFIHFQIKFRLLHLGKSGSYPVAEIFTLQYRQIKRYRQFYTYFLPLFSGIATLVYLQNYSMISLSSQMIITFSAGLLGFVLARVVWKLLYQPTERRLSAFTRIQRFASGLKEVA